MTRKGRGWFRESVREIVVVVVSIVIAFSVDAWWDTTLERREERELLENLLRDFRGNEDRLELRIRNHRRIAGAAEELARQLSAAGSRGVSVADSLILSLLVTPTFDPTLGTLEEAQSSGRTGLIRNAELRARLGAWTGLWRDAREEERLAQELVQIHVFEAIANALDLSDLMDHGGLWLAERLPGEIGARERSMTPTPGLVNYAKVRSVRSRRASEELTDLRAELRRIIELLAAEVEG